MKREMKAPTRRANSEALPKTVTKEGPNHNVGGPIGHMRQMGEIVRNVGLGGVVFGVNPLAAHGVAYVNGPAMLAYGFAVFCMLLFFFMWVLKSFPRFKDMIL
jgi:hypothetical protein